MDNEVAKATQRLLTKQGMKFKLNTKVLKGQEADGAFKVNVEASKGGKEETVSKPC
jgi:dihydrolipoamide dehydrogenase